MSIIILGIESSCDDTSASVCIDGAIKSNIVASQLVHEQWGGVVPELASRAHLQNIVPVVDAALKKAGISVSDLSSVAVTRGPGLVGSLWVGLGFAKALSVSLNIPLIEVHHMKAHIMAHFIDNQPNFPFLCLTVSGGHTQLVKVRSHTNFEILGETLDDAAGEAFDKCSKLLGLPYPGGPHLDRLSKSGNPIKFKFPEPKIEGLDFSFSGFKTSVMYFLERSVKENPSFVSENLHDLCASIQYSIVRFLIRKSESAIIETGIRNISLAGGVSANSLLREEFSKLAQKYEGRAFIPAFEYCTDNAAMIAISGYYKYLNKDFCNLNEEVFAR